MELLIAILQGVVGFVFLAYGIACLCFGAMKSEFERYGLAGFRRLVGCLEILGGSGLLFGLHVKAISIAASAGLCALMIMGIVVRWRLNDSWVQMAPAILLGAINTIIFFYRFGSIFWF